MTNMEDAYTKQFLKRFRENLNFKKLQGVFEAVLGKAVWEVLSCQINPQEIAKSDSFAFCLYDNRRDPQTVLKCTNFIMDIVESAG